MIKTEAFYLVDIIGEIQEKLDTIVLPVNVKVDFGEPLEGADIGLTVYVDGERNWKVHDKINSVIQDILEKYSLIPFIHWKYKQ